MSAVYPQTFATSGWNGHDAANKRPKRCKHMAELDREHNRLIVKLVYYSPALSKKTQENVDFNHCPLCGEQIKESNV